MIDIGIRILTSFLYGPYLWFKYIISGVNSEKAGVNEDSSELIYSLNNYQNLVVKGIELNDKMMHIIKRNAELISKKIENSSVLRPFEKDYCYDVLSQLGHLLLVNISESSLDRVSGILKDDLLKIKELASSHSSTYGFDDKTVNDALDGDPDSIMTIFLDFESR